jgi:hypothetical protein
MKLNPYIPYILSQWDLFLTPVYLILVFFIISRWKKKHYAGSPLGRFIMPAFILRVLGCIFLALIYQYFYGYGDTFKYFTGGHEIWQAFIHSPKIAIEITTNQPENYSSEALEYAQYSGYQLFSNSIYAMFKITGVTGLFCFGTYLPMALIFCLLSFWGTWMIFITINKHFPHLYKYTAISCLFIPSVIIWSNGILKEPLCMFGLGLCFYSFDNFLHKKSLFKNLLFFAAGTLILLVLKDYIFYAFLVAALVWTYRFYIVSLQNLLSKIAVKAIIYTGIFAFLFYFFWFPSNPVQESITDYLTKGENLQNAMTSINETYGGSSYTFSGINDQSATGLLKSYFAALNVALFRPYIWECSNVLMVMNFLQSFGAFILVLFVLFKVGLLKIIRYCNKNPILVFCLVFTLVLAPIVGFISFNFGTLIRYAIPFQPFLFSFLLIIFFEKKGEKVYV